MKKVNIILKSSSSKTKLLARLVVILFCIQLLFSCKKEELNHHSPLALMEVPDHFDPIPVPEDNTFSQDRWTLGKKLFYDPILSVDSTKSCASCHLADHAFSDIHAVSQGVNMALGTRNTPSLANVAYHPYYTREGGVPSLEMQILVPIQEHNEFNFNIVLVAERLSNNPAYVELSQKAYDRDPDAFVITRALANFERTLISANSTYDQYLRGISRLSAQESKGKELFFSDRLGCGGCHGDFNFTDYSFTNNGLYLDYEDEGRYRFTSKTADLATFKTPSLRNVSATAPYMHDGSITSLSEVIDHYENGVKAHINKSPKIKSFSLTEQERMALLSFLESLTDEEFIDDLRFKN